VQTTHGPLHLGKKKKIDWYTEILIESLFISFGGVYEYDDGGILKLLKCMQNLHQLKWYHESANGERRYSSYSFLTMELQLISL
jgi:hypothetical protein